MYKQHRRLGVVVPFVGWDSPCCGPMELTVSASRETKSRDGTQPAREAVL